MIKDNLYFDAQDKLIDGINKVSKAVAVTMGTSGSNAIIEAIEHPGHLLTNDGYTIANSILLEDPIEDMGRKILLESINRSNKASGDGSSTTCVLTAAIINEGKEYKGKVHPMELKNSIEACLPIIEASLERQTRKIVDEDGTIDTKMLRQVATISAEDEDIGRRIAQIYSEIGPKGLIHWDISKTTDDSYTVGNGITVDGATYISPYMCDATENGQGTNEVRLRKPLILITKQKISSGAELGNLARELFESSIHDLIVFAEDIDPILVPGLIKLRLEKGFRVVIIKMPVLWKDEWYTDLALATGATVIDPTYGVSLRDLKKEHLGTVDNIVITREDTNLDGIEDLKAHIQTLEQDGEEDSKLRASRLNTKTARYYVGAQSDSALSYRRLKVEDAISAAFHALNGGIVAGGGKALANAANGLPTDTVGGKILRVALRTPFHVILNNAGFPWENVDEELKKSVQLDEGFGFNTKTFAWVGMFEEGIVDPKVITVNAVRNAVSVAATILTAPTIVTLPREVPNEIPKPM